jgi:hypothetical protein
MVMIEARHSSLLMGFIFDLLDSSLLLIPSLLVTHSIIYDLYSHFLVYHVNDMLTHLLTSLNNDHHPKYKLD